MATRAWNFCGVHSVPKVENLCDMGLLTCTLCAQKLTSSQLLLGSCSSTCFFAVNKKYFGGGVSWIIWTATAARLFIGGVHVQLYRHLSRAVLPRQLREHSREGGS